MFDPHLGTEGYSCVQKCQKLVIRLTLEKTTGLTPLLSSLLFCADGKFAWAALGELLGASSVQ